MFAVPAEAEVSSAAAVIIDEVYGGGGNSGAAFAQDFIELYNTTDQPVSLDGWSVQYASATGTWANGSQTNLTGTIPAHGSFLVGQATGSNTTLPALPTPDATGTIAMSGSGAKVALVNATARLGCAGVACATDPAVADLVGWGATASSYAGTAPAPATTNATSVSRTNHVNTADNAADFTAGTPTPTNAGPGTEPTPSPSPSDPSPSPTPSDPAGVTPIAEIQGAGAASPLAGRTVTTEGVVTATYPTGGFNGYTVQTAGTGGPIDPATHTASDAVFVFSSATDDLVQVGDLVRVTGAVSEFQGLTEITVTAAAGLQVLGTGSVTPAVLPWPATGAVRESLESMLYDAGDSWTISNTFTANNFSEVGLAFGDGPLVQPTDVARPGTPEAAAQAAQNAERAVTLDDGASVNFLSSANSGLTPPYISLASPVRVGASVDFTEPVIVDYRNNAWKLNPTRQVTADGAKPAVFENDRPAAPEVVGGDVSVASFNVLNYFTTLGEHLTGCSSYNDRTGDPVTVNSCPGNGPRGAYEAEDLARQQAKIVAAINGLDADVVGLLEIENSFALGETPDEATATLVAALNAAAGSEKWAYVPSSADLPPASEMDVITNAIIFQPAAVERVGASRALGELSGTGEAFDNAREPVGQAFAPVGGGESFFVAVNHFKSKGSAGPWPGDADTGDGQGSSNESRVRQATALRDWVATVTEPAQPVALVGDFNAYTQEDPMQVLYAAGYTNAAATLAAGQHSYSFSGQSGSLDHVLLNGPAMALATGADVWEINAEESVALEYSRYNYHGTLFYEDGPFRSSDHNPAIVGLDLVADPIELDLVNINDFHGRIDANTVKFAGTVEGIRAENPEGTLFVSAGDNIGASLFASALQQDQPTLDVLDALGLATSAVGNHEFDQGFADLTGRVEDTTDFDHLGANVYDESTGEPALPAYEVVEADGVRVGFVGVVTQETPTLVTPSGVAGLEFGDPVAALNRVTGELLDGDPANGEADVVIALVHDGASAGTPDGATLEEEIAAGGPFARLVTETDARVSAILTGHTHKQYAWDAPVPGVEGATRPIIQTGNYGEFLGHISFSVDPQTFAVLDYTVQNVARTTTADATLVATYPRVAEVKTIVDAALAEANVIGAQPVGSVTADVTSAFAGGSYVNGVWTGGARDDRASESALGNLVANSLRDTLADETRGGADLGVVNPGGLRNELRFAPDGTITYAEANAVLPFVNNLWTITLTGAQIDELLEQQWQTDAAGNRPSRPYLALGLSDNVSYTVRTADPLATPGDNVTSISIDGVPVDPAAEYRVATFSFLISGGDNFRVFTQGTGGRDSGLIDRDAWIAYLRGNSPITPSFARTRVVVGELPGAVEAGAAVEVGVSSLNLTSLGSPENTSVSAYLVPVGGTAEQGTALGDFPVSAGAATVAVTVPEGTTAGEHTLLVTAAPSGTTVRVPLTVTAPAFPEWDRRSVYTAGDRVTYEGTVFEALWWTRGARPGASAWGAWAEVGATVECASGTTTAWTDSWIYQGGDTVAHDGHLWTARWYTRNQEPGASKWGPWEDLGAC
nr:ExeM/NucH family extracellular endonuclease [Antribacter gilvus]